jgi:hypothetical protein
MNTWQDNVHYVLIKTSKGKQDFYQLCVECIVEAAKDNVKIFIPFIFINL